MSQDRRRGESFDFVFAASSAAWLRIVEHRGRAGVESAYRAMVEGRIDPAEGHIVSLPD